VVRYFTVVTMSVPILRMKALICSVVVGVLALVYAQSSGPHIVSAMVEAGVYVSGNVSSLEQSDDNRYLVNSESSTFSGGWHYEEARVSSDLDLTGADLSSTINITVEASCDAVPPTGATLFLYFYDWQTNEWEYAHSSSLNTSETVRTLQIGGPYLAKYVTNGDIVRIAIRGFSQDNSTPGGTVSTAPFQLRIDQIGLPGTSSSAFNAPGNLQAAAQSINQIDLSWIDSTTTETGFRVERRIGNGAWTFVANTLANATTFSDASLSPNTTYEFRVRAFNTTQVSTWSNVASASTFPVASLKPDLVVAATASDKITLYWSGINGSIGYDIYRSFNELSGYVKLNSTPITSVDPGPGLVNRFMYSDSGIQSGIEYFYRVQPVLSSTTFGEFSNVASDVPGSWAIPWDTGNTASILSKVDSQRSSDAPVWASSTYDWVVAVGPNQVVYMNHLKTQPASSNPPTASYDPEANLFKDIHGIESPVVRDDLIEGEGNSNNPIYVEPPVLPPAGDHRGQNLSPSQVNDDLVAHFLPKQPFAQGTTNTTPYQRTNPPSGIFRKVAATSGKQLITGVAVLPSTTSGLSQTAGQKDTAYIYTGGEGGGHALDIGFQKGSQDVTGWGLVALHHSPNAEGLWNAFDLGDVKSPEPGVNNDLAGKFRFSGPVLIAFCIPSPQGLPNQTGTFVLNWEMFGGAFHNTAEGVTEPPHKVKLQVFLRDFKQSNSAN
jgi:hypothetical protein